MDIQEKIYYIPRQIDNFFFSECVPFLSGISIRETARILEVRPNAIYNRVKYNTIIHFKVNDRTWILDKSVAYLRAKKDKKKRDKRIFCCKMSTSITIKEKEVKITCNVYSQNALMHCIRRYPSVLIEHNIFSKLNIEQELKELKGFKYNYYISDTQYICITKHKTHKFLNVNVMEKHNHVFLKIKNKTFLKLKKEFLEKLRTNKKIKFLEINKYNNYT